MAKADLVLPNGTAVRIEGSPEEVALLLAKVSGTTKETSVSAPRRGKKKRPPRTGSPAKKSVGTTGLITELADEGFFKAKRTIGDVQKKLEERGHIYALTSISPTLFRLTRSRIIRRIKGAKGWVYVK